METRGLIWLKAGLAALGMSAFLAAPAGSAAAAVTLKSDDMDPSTRANMVNAMEGEAMAHATYRAYAAQADKEGLPAVRALFERTAASELREHLPEQARQLGLVGDNPANLRDSTEGESYEAATMYQRFAAEAEEDGDQKAAALFSEISKDEASHRSRFTRAAKAVSDPSSGAVIPTDVTAKPASIRAGAPQVSSPRTMRNLRTALRGEALAHAKYTLYADRARETGQPKLATLFDRTAEVERAEHFAEQANLAGLVRDSRTNLRNSIAGETDEGNRMYPQYARQAAAVGDTTAAELFKDTASDELAHARAFNKALSTLDAQASASP
jgi:rubrerythrin